jgi:hypothetical protein
MLNKIKKSVSDILQYDGIVKFSYKSSLDSWYSEISISNDLVVNSCYISGGGINGSYKLSEGIDIFVNFIFNENNLAYVINRINKKNKINLGDEYDFENPEQELVDMIFAEQELIKIEKNKY